MGNVLAGTMDPGCSSIVLVTKQHQFNPYGGAWFAGVPPLYNLRPAARAVQHPAGGWSVFAIWGGSCRFRVVWLPPATGTQGAPYNDGALDGWDGWPAAGTYAGGTAAVQFENAGGGWTFCGHFHRHTTGTPVAAPDQPLSVAQGLALQAAGPFVLGVDFTIEERGFNSGGYREVWRVVPIVREDADPATLRIADDLAPHWAKRDAAAGDAQDP